MRIKSLPYPDLRWEKTRQFNLGADMAFWNGRLRAGLNYYHKHTVDVVDKVDIPFEYGMEYMYRNGSELFNKGLEVALSLDVIKNQATTFTISMNTSRNFNRKDDGNPRSDLNSFLNGQGHLPGKPVSGFYSYIFNGLSPVNGQPTFKNITASEQAVKFTDPGQFLVYSGQMDPTLTLSVSPSLQYKAFSIRTHLYAVMGNTRRLNPPFGRNYSNNGIPGTFTNVSREYLDRWRKPGMKRIPTSRRSWIIKRAAITSCLTGARRWPAGRAPITWSCLWKLTRSRITSPPTEAISDARMLC